MPKRTRRVIVDSRFKSMFSDSKFKTKYSVDKRGRPIKKTSKEDLKKFYEIGKEDDAHENGPSLAMEESNSESSGESDIDFSDIRGGALSSSSSDEDGDVDDVEYGEKEIEHDWGELDKDAKRKDNAVTSRLAVCNMDWDKVTANDLFVLFSSFGSFVKSVKIYLSEFGKQRLAEEDLSGPVELKKEGEEELNDVEEEGDSNNIEGASFHMEKLRKYQLNRLKYYYAIAEFDSKEAANMIYENYDGIEYELAATRLDLRFVPDETEFEDEPKQIATEVPMLGNYQPTLATHSALQQSTVRLTWDETNPQRLEVTMRKFNKDELDDMDFKAYLATSSESEREEEENTNGGNEVDIIDEDTGNKTEESKDDEDERIKKYKALLQEIEVKEKKDDNDQHMEISWEPALSESAEQIVKNKIEKEQEKSLTPWEKYLKGKKKKSKEKSGQSNKGKEDMHKSDEEDEGNSLQDSEQEDEEEYIPAGTDDPFFVHSDEADERKEEKESSNRNKKKRSRKRREQNRKQGTDDDSQEREELELLLMDDREEKQHFNMKEIIDNEKRKRKRKKGKQGREEIVDQFEIDVHDKRFSALFNSPDYILDPSDPQFKKTKAMDKIIEEKQNRRKLYNVENSKDAADGTRSTSRMNPSLSALVNSVKTRTEQFRQKKKFKS